MLFWWSLFHSIDTPFRGVKNEYRIAIFVPYTVLGVTKYTVISKGSGILMVTKVGIKIEPIKYKPSW